MQREHRRLCPGDEELIHAAAADALAHRVRLLGPETVELGPSIDWLRDFRSGVAWPRRYMRDIEYVNPDDASDVKVPWELSRLQWLMPAGQAYLLTGEERYAEAVRAVLESWIDANPYAESVNWSCTMEAALRILTWTWFFRVFHASRAWADAGFRERFLCALYLHGDFTERHLELSDVNGNHCTADAAGLVFAGLFFGQGADAGRWLARGWSLLLRGAAATGLSGRRRLRGVGRLPPPGGRAVPAAGALPARLRARRAARLPRAPGRDGALQRGLLAPRRGTPALGRRGRRARAAARSPGAHRPPLPGGPGRCGVRRSRSCGTPRPAAAARPSGCSGPRRRQRCPRRRRRRGHRAPRRFPDGGFYVMRNAVDHVFVDCGPVGLAGRGGHGHNDCLAFEAVLDGVHLVSDCGTFVYTASFAERNRFRSTAYHNTPRVDGQEINRIDPRRSVDARRTTPGRSCGRSKPAPSATASSGLHTGYRRLASPVTPVRTIELDHREHSLAVRDTLRGRRTSPLRGAAAPRPRGRGDPLLARASSSCARAAAASSSRGSPAQAWALEIGAGRVSPSYGVSLPIVRLLFTREGPLEPGLSVRIAPAAQRRDGPRSASGWPRWWWPALGAARSRSWSGHASSTRRRPESVGSCRPAARARQERRAP